jgi:hypothetical protein
MDDVSKYDRANTLYFSKWFPFANRLIRAGHPEWSEHVWRRAGRVWVRRQQASRNQLGPLPG